MKKWNVSKYKDGYLLENENGKVICEYIDLETAKYIIKAVEFFSTEEEVGKEVAKILLQETKPNQNLVDLFSGKTDSGLPL